MFDSDDLYTHEAAEYVQLSEFTLRNRRYEGLPPESYRDVRGRVRYPRASLDAFIADRKSATTVGAR